MPFTTILSHHHLTHLTPSIAMIRYLYSLRTRCCQCRLTIIQRPDNPISSPCSKRPHRQSLQSRITNIRPSPLRSRHISLYKTKQDENKRCNPNRHKQCLCCIRNTEIGYLPSTPYREECTMGINPPTK